MPYTQYADSLENDSNFYSLPVGVTKIISNAGSLSDTSVVLKFGIDDETVAVNEELGVKLSSETKKPLEEKLGIIGLLDAEKIRFKEHLMNKMLSDFDSDLSVPQVQTTSPLISQMKAGNDLKQKQHEREIMLAKADTEYKKMQVQLRMKELELREHANSIAESQLYMQGQLYDQNERIILQNSTMIKNMANLKSVIAQKTSTIDASGGTFNLDTTDLTNALNSIKENQVQTNTKIIEGIENQKETNSKIVENIIKKNEQLDFEKDGVPTLKDSSGNVVKPREVKALNNAEQTIYKTAENTYNWKDSTEQTLNHLDGALNGGSGTGEGGIGLDEVNLLKLLDKFLSHDKTVYSTENTSKVFSGEGQ